MRKIRTKTVIFVSIFLIGGTLALSNANQSSDNAARDGKVTTHYGRPLAEVYSACMITMNDKYPENLSSQIAQLEEDIKTLDKEIALQRKELKDLYKMAEDGKDVWNEIYTLRSEIDSLNKEKALKKDRLVILIVFQQFTKKGENGEILIVKEAMPPIEDIEIARARESLGESCKDLTLKTQELEQMYTEAKKGENPWGRIRKIEEDIESAESTAWQIGDEYVRLQATKRLSEGANILNECSAPSPFLPNATHYFSSFVKTRVWVGMYSTTTPNINYLIDQFCTSTFNKDLTHYWNIAKIRKPSTNSIQVKFFYTATCQYDGKRHDLIWEGNKNASGYWWTYAEYKTIDPIAGSYNIICYSIGGVCQRYLSCCGGPLYQWCNTHCGLCFACDVDATQHFVNQNP